MEAWRKRKGAWRSPRTLVNGRGSSCLYLKERILAVLMSSLWRWISIYLWGIYVQTTYPVVSLWDMYCAAFSWTLFGNRFFFVNIEFCSNKKILKCKLCFLVWLTISWFLRKLKWTLMHMVLIISRIFASQGFLICSSWQRSVNYP